MPDFDDTIFFGGGYEESKDKKRLAGQLKKVHDFMLDFKAHTLAEISQATDAPESSVSACLRTLRNQYGFCIEKERVKDGAGTWHYWVGGGGLGIYSRNPRKMKPIGNAAKFGAMMQAIYAYAAQCDLINLAEIRKQSEIWALDFAEQIRNR